MTAKFLLPAKGEVIDADTTRYAEDAIYVERTDDGWRVHACFVDVASAIPIGSPEDKSAFWKAETWYMDGTAEWMISPVSMRQLAFARYASSPCLYFVVTLDENLDPIYLDGGIRVLESPQMYPFSKIERILRNPSHEAFQRWNLLYQFASRLNDKRVATGSIAAQAMKSDFVKGLASVKATRRNNSFKASMIVGEAITLVNTVLSAQLAEQGAHLIWRNQRINRKAVKYNAKLGLIDTGIVTPSGVQMGRLRRKARKTLRPPHYSTVCEGHSGLVVSAYARWSSPLRRYADLVNHRMLRAYLLGKTPPYSLAELTQIADHLAAKEDIYRQEVARREYALDDDSGMSRRALFGRAFSYDSPNFGTPE